MSERIVEIADDRRHVFVDRGFLVVRNTNNSHQEIGRVPIDDISAVIANAHGVSYTNNLLVALVQRGAPFVLCGPNHNAVGMLLSVDGNHLQAKRFDAQIAASRPLMKRLWKSIVKSKVGQQAATLRKVGKADMTLLSLVKRVQSGDPGNIEGQAARRYWRILFGDDFRRDINGDGINGLLNYGYTVLRSATARAVIAAGLHPTLGIHHSNEGNAMRLVDDLVEPFRPIIDAKAIELTQTGCCEVSPEAKRAMAAVLQATIKTADGLVPVSVSMQRLAISLAQVYLKEREDLNLPLPCAPRNVMTER